MPIPQGHLAVLRQICAALEGAPVVWAITGSTGFALQGMPVTAHDIDLQTTAAGAYAIEGRLLAFSTRPVALSAASHIRSHFGALEIGGVVVELMGDIQKRADDGSWEPPVDLEAHRRLICYEGLLLPVLSLAYEAQAYRRLGRLEQAERLQRWLSEQPGPEAGGRTL